MTDHAANRVRRSRRAALALGLAALPLAIPACTPGVGTTPTTQAGQLTNRAITVSSGAYSVTNAIGISNGTGEHGFRLDYNSSSAVVGVHGTLSFDRGTGPGPSLTLDLTADVFGLTGSATLVDPTAPVSVHVVGTASAFSADDHGNVSGSISADGTTVSFATSSPAAAASDAALQTLLAAETDYCAEAQRSIAGLDPLQVPLSSIVSTHETPRATFAASKSVLSPLTVRTWTDAVDVSSSSSPAVVTISQHISCKMRSGDHIATTGVTTSPADAACSTLNQKSFTLALAQLSAGEQALVSVPNLGADVVRQTGAEWTTPLASGTEFNGSTLLAHALQVNWTDPNFAIFPDTIRGVHYCTVWSPAYAYFYLRSTLP